MQIFPFHFPLPVQRPCKEKILTENLKILYSDLHLFMPHPDFPYIRLSHSIAEPLQRKKKIVFQRLFGSHFSLLQQWGIRVMASPEFWFNSLWLFFLFNISFIQLHPVGQHFPFHFDLFINRKSYTTGDLLTCKTHKSRALPRQEQQWHYSSATEPIWVLGCYLVHF